MPSSHLKYWLTPSDIYDRLDEEFHFTCDPCPYPLPHPSYSSLHLPWGKSNYVNPPFCRVDNTEGLGITSFVRKAIKEQRKGKQSVLIGPTLSYVNTLIEAGAEVRSMGRVGWISCVSGEACSPTSTAIYILRGTPVKPTEEKRRRILTLLLDAHDAVLKGKEEEAPEDVQSVIQAAVKAVTDAGDNQ